MARNKYAITYSDAGSVIKMPGSMFTPKDGGQGLKNIDVSVISTAFGNFAVTDFRLIAVTISSTTNELAGVEWDNGLTVQTDYSLKPIRVKPMKQSQEGFWHTADKGNANTLVDFKGKLEYIEVAVRFGNL